MKKLFFALLTLWAAEAATAQTFEYTYGGKTLTYSVIDKTAQTCEVIVGANGDVIIPRVAQYNGTLYMVTQIGKKAFYQGEFIRVYPAR